MAKVRYGDGPGYGEYRSSYRENVHADEQQMMFHFIKIPLTHRKDRIGADNDFDIRAEIDLSDLASIPKGARVLIEYDVDEMLDYLVIEWMVDA